MKLLAYGFLFVLAMTGMKKCDGDVGGDTANMNETFELKLNESVIIKGEKVGIKFIKNIESRCPANTNCMRAGEAKAKFVLSNGGTTEDLTLEAKGNCQKEDGSCGTSKSAMGYTVKLISLNPYPGTTKETVTAKLQVTK